MARNAWIVALSNCATSIFAGFVIFAVLGFLAEEHDAPIDNIVRGGWALAYEVYPAALASFPQGVAQTMSVIFWVTLLTLGIDSSFSLAESAIKIFTDRFDVAARHRKLTALGVCLAGFLLGLPMATRAGYHVLLIQDSMLSRHTLVLVGLSESVLVGWVYGASHLDKHVTQMTGKSLGMYWRLCVKFVTPPLLACLFLWNIVEEASGGGEGLINRYPSWALVVFGWIYGVVVPVAFAVIASGFPLRLDRRKGPPFQEGEAEALHQRPRSDDLSEAQQVAVDFDDKEEPNDVA